MALPKTSLFGYPRLTKPAGTVLLQNTQSGFQDSIASVFLHPMALKVPCAQTPG
jgi:hypothetical protein